MTGLVRVDYAGPGGTCEGMRMLGLEPVGIEWDAAACATRAAAGHLTIRADLATYRPHHEPGSVWGYWASPPCQTFSNTGSRGGLAAIPEMIRAVKAEDWSTEHHDDRTAHVLHAARTACTIGAEWIAMEQVPAVDRVFSALANVLNRYGYWSWSGVVNAADFGVPQTRRRAVLIASRSTDASIPERTHAAEPTSGLFHDHEPWVTMASALGWDPPPDGMSDLARWPWLQPATTVAGDPRISARCHHEHGAQGADARSTERVRAGDYDGTQPIRLTVAEAKTLQTFPADYPVQGNQGQSFQQIGNAVPPLLAARIAGAASGLRLAAPVGVAS